MSSINIANLWKYDLRKGKTDHPANGACLYDAAKWIVYGQIGDDPQCACPIIREYAITLNDQMPDDLRQELLKPMILRVVGNIDPIAEPLRLRWIIEQTCERIIAPLYDIPEFQVLRNVNKMNYKQISKAANAAYAAIDTAAAYTDAVDAAYAVANAAAHAANAANAAAHAADAANAAAHSANAARAAFYAAHSANAAYAAVDVANAAANTAANAVWSIAIEILDGALRIGKQAPEFEEDQVISAVEAFEKARAKELTY